MIDKVLVFYKKKGAADWGHVAMIVETALPQTYYESPLSSESDTREPRSRDDECEQQYLVKPRIVDRSGNIKYIDSRSIDNMPGEYSAVAVVHIH